jgi:hypothetical protein
MLNLVVAVFWLLFATTLIVDQFTLMYLERRSAFTLAGLAMVMTIWNIARWYFTRQERQRRAARNAAARALDQPTRRTEPLSEPDPAFDFTNAAPPPPVRRAQGPPPGE